MSTKPEHIIPTMEDGHHLCWSCKEEVGAGPFCKHCVKIQPIDDEVSDYFKLFGIDKKYDIDLGAVRKQFFELSKQLHPDFYSEMTDEEKIIARDDTAYINNALKVLSDPIRRADYLLTLLAGNTTSNPAPPQDLFDEILESGELIIADTLTEEERAQLLAAGKSFAERQSKLLQSLAEPFDHFSAGDAVARGTIESRLNNIKYLRTIMGRIETRLSQPE